MKNLVLIPSIVIAVALSSGANARSESKDYTICKRAVEEIHPEAQIQPRKIRSRFIDLWVRNPGEDKETVRCLREDYSLVERGE